MAHRRPDIESHCLADRGITGMNVRLRVVIIGSLFLCSTCVDGQEPSGASDRIERLLSEDRQARAQARREVFQDRKALISQLSSAIEAKAQRTSNEHVVGEWMSILGDLRANEAIDVLVKHIGYPRTAKIDDRVPTSAARVYFSSSGPAVDALVRIGEPCVDAVIWKIRTTKVREERIACVSVLRRLGIPFTRERLEKSKTTATETAEASLNEALQLFDEWISPEERVKRIQRKLEEQFEKTPPK
jgi:hypothetical protein